VRRTDRSGRRRYTDCEWDLPDGRVVVLEVDGLPHGCRELGRDMARERELVIGGRIVIRCTARGLRDDPERIVRDLIALGVRRLSA
jgi:very-short-patch-repair endonuclease